MTITKTRTTTTQTTTIETSTNARLHKITLATIEGDKTTYSAMQATSHAAALKAAREAASEKATVRAYYSPFGATLPLAAMHVTASTLSGIVKRGVGDVPRQQRQLAAARKALHAMAQHGPKAIAIPHDIADHYQTAALALITHTAPLSGITPRDIAEAYSAAMCAVQRAYRADTRGVQQAEAGQEMPRMYGSPTMRTSAARRRAPQAYVDAIAAIRAAYIAQARDQAAAARVMDYWTANPECTSFDMGDALKLNRRNASRRMEAIRRIANELYPKGVSVR